MRIYKKKAPLRGEADSINFDLLGGEINVELSTRPPLTQINSKPLPGTLRQLYARLPLALDDDSYPILARNWPMDTKRQILKLIRLELEKLEVHYG